MPRLRSFPPDFILKNRGFRSPEKSLAQSSASGSLLADYDLACRAGKSVSAIVKQARLPLDYSSGRGVRIEDGGKITFITDNALQLSRLRNLSKRMLEKLVTDGVPVVKIEFRLRPRRSVATQNAPSEAERTPSLIAARSLKESARSLANPELRHQILALAEVLAPRPEELPLALIAALENTSARFTELIHRADRIFELLPDAPDEKLIPDERSAGQNERLAGVRARMLARQKVRSESEQALTEIKTLSKEALEQISEMLADLIVSDASQDLAPDEKKLEALADQTFLSAKKAGACARRLDEIEDFGGRLPPDRTDAPAVSSASVPEQAVLQPGEDVPQTVDEETLRAELKKGTAKLKKLITSSQAILLHARIRLPELPDILASDGRLAQEAAALARAREQGAEGSALAKSLSAESSRKLISWESKVELAARLENLDQEFAQAAKRLEAVKPLLRAPRTKTAYLARAEALLGLKKLDGELQAETARLETLSAEAETLSERVEILRSDLPSEALSGISPEETQRTQVLEALFERLKGLESILGRRPNPAIIPTEEEARKNREFAAIRTRQLERIKRYDERFALIKAARETCESIDRVLTAPRGEAMTEKLAALVEKALEEAVAKFESARAAVAPDSAPFDRNAVLEAAAKASSPQASEEKPFEALALENEFNLEPEDPETQLKTQLKFLEDILPVWQDRLPARPDPKLIPKEDECEKSEALRALRERMLKRGRRRDDLEERLGRIKEALRAVRERLRNPLSDLTETLEIGAALLREADRFSADLA